MKDWDVYLSVRHDEMTMKFRNQQPEHLGVYKADDCLGAVRTALGLTHLTAGGNRSPIMLSTDRGSVYEMLHWAENTVGGQMELKPVPNTTVWKNPVFVVSAFLQSDMDPDEEEGEV